MNNNLEKVCIFYGYPISISGYWSVESAVEIYQNYDIVVYGEGYNNPSHEAYEDTVNIVNTLIIRSPELKIYGYVPCAADKKNDKEKIKKIKENIELWKRIKVSGIFLDEFGYDYLNTRERQNEIIKFCRESNLKIFVNSWNDDWLFSSKNIKLDWIPNHITNPKNIECILTKDDYFLYENMFWYVENGIQCHSLPMIPHRAYNYFNMKKTEFFNKTYYEKFGCKCVSLDGILKSLEGTKRYENMMDISIYFSKILNIHGVAFANETWGANGFYRDWSSKKIDLKRNIENRIECKFYSGYPKEYLSKIDEDEIKIIWSNKDNNIETGIRQVILNEKVVAEDYSYVNIKKFFYKIFKL